MGYCRHVDDMLESQDVMTHELAIAEVKTDSALRFIQYVLRRDISNGFFPHCFERASTRLIPLEVVSLIIISSKMVRMQTELGK